MSGLTGIVPKGLPQAISDQSEAAGETVEVHRYDDVATAEEAVRDGDIGVLVIGARRLEWRRQTDEQMRGILTSAIQGVEVQERATAAGISPDALLELIAPVPVESVELGSFAGGARTTSWPRWSWRCCCSSQSPRTGDWC